MATEKKTEARTEVYEATRPNGEVVRITRNIDTGEQSVKVVGTAKSAKGGE